MTRAVAEGEWRSERSHWCHDGRINNAITVRFNQWLMTDNREPYNKFWEWFCDARFSVLALEATTQPVRRERLAHQRWHNHPEGAGAQWQGLMQRCRYGTTAGGRRIVERSRKVRYGRSSAIVAFLECTDFEDATEMYFLVITGSASCRGSLWNEWIRCP